MKHILIGGLIVALVVALYVGFVNMQQRTVMRVAEKKALIALRSEDSRRLYGIPDAVAMSQLELGDLDWIGRESIVSYRLDDGNLLFVKLKCERGVSFVPRSFRESDFVARKVWYYRNQRPNPNS